jgi:hypothetical protein
MGFEEPDRHLVCRSQSGNRRQFMAGAMLSYVASESEADENEITA